MWFDKDHGSLKDPASSQPVMGPKARSPAHSLIQGAKKPRLKGRAPLKKKAPVVNHRGQTNPAQVS